ncbi:GNAT family N-acetyltransferase [Nostoc sp. CENA67]|uniref:GNAT family N-acetyltransferase n=1 Tax=Amazonocrinis nigriterrae CENA67 TaxID=2794033 RepID=A0A8J7HNG7_9NOST|nr:GNAT family N-acetyltransferase [Amazonocrinis nigriterrae]MBH8561555.1 GNAT family N-acetyltransferase [Amazonocrinis nigriterrae CENA67]
MSLELIQANHVEQKYTVLFKIAESRSETRQCQSLVSEVYYKKLGISFSETEYDIEAKIELYPHHYLMGVVNDEIVACMGLYLHSTNPERYGKVTEQDIDQLLIEAGAANRYSGKHIRELSKFVVKDEWRKKGLGKLLMGAAHSRDFIHMNEEQPHLLVSCANTSIFQYFSDTLEIRTRTIKPVPFYKIHEFYRADREAMESRLTIPDIDIPAKWYNATIPGEYQL